MTREDINDIINAICPNDEDYEKPCISPKYLRQELEQLALDQRQWNEDLTTKNDLGVREFEEIVVEYPPEDLCTYPEYKGKPYFSIKYKEGNDYFIGYGTYNPKVFSRYLRDYFMPSVTPQFSSELEKNSKKLAKDFGELDCISRADALALYCDKCGLYNCISKCASYRAVEKMPSVTPIRPKGHWIKTNDYFTGAYESIDYVECSCCHADSLEEGNYCPNCGAEMSEVEE